jgi:hypothetical protein
MYMDEKTEINKRSADLRTRQKIKIDTLIIGLPVTVAERLGHALSSLARKPGSWVRIPLRAWMFSACVCAFFCVRVQVEALRPADHPPN